MRASQGAWRRSTPEWWFPFQYGNPSNPKAHYEGTGPEIWRDVPEITHFIAGLGTAGTLMGVGHFLKEQNPDIQIWAIEPPAGEMVDGLKNIDEGFIPPVYEDNHGNELLNRRLIVRPRESIEWTRRLTEVGIFAGISSGAILAGAVEGRQPHRGGHRSSMIVVATAAGSTSPPACGPTTSTSSKPAPRPTIYFWSGPTSAGSRMSSGGRPRRAWPSVAHEDRPLDEDGVRRP